MEDGRRALDACATTSRILEIRRPTNPGQDDSSRFDLRVVRFFAAPLLAAEELFLLAVPDVRLRALVVFFAAVLRVVPDFAVLRAAAAFLPPFADAVRFTGLP